MKLNIRAKCSGVTCSSFNDISKQVLQSWGYEHQSAGIIAEPLGSLIPAWHRWDSAAVRRAGAWSCIPWLFSDWQVSSRCLGILLPSGIVHVPCLLSVLWWLTDYTPESQHGVDRSSSNHSLLVKGGEILKHWGVRWLKQDHSVLDSDSRWYVHFLFHIIEQWYGLGPKLNTELRGMNKMTDCPCGPPRFTEKNIYTWYVGGERRVKSTVKAHGSLLDRIQEGSICLQLSYPVWICP